MTINVFNGWLEISHKKIVSQKFDIFPHTPFGWSKKNSFSTWLTVYLSEEASSDQHLTSKAFVIWNPIFF